jgi:hypothetical protein
LSRLLRLLYPHLYPQPGDAQPGAGLTGITTPANAAASDVAETIRIVEPDAFSPSRRSPVFVCGCCFEGDISGDGWYSEKAGAHQVRFNVPETATALAGSTVAHIATSLVDYDSPLRVEQGVLVVLPGPSGASGVTEGVTGGRRQGRAREVFVRSVPRRDVSFPRSTTCTA